MSLEEQKEKFRIVAKRILKKNLSTNIETLNKYVSHFQKIPNPEFFKQNTFM